MAEWWIAIQVEFMAHDSPTQVSDNHRKIFVHIVNFLFHSQTVKLSPPLHY